MRRLRCVWTDLYLGRRSEPKGTLAPGQRLALLGLDEAGFQPSGLGESNASSLRRALRITRQAIGYVTPGRLVGNVDVARRLDAGVIVEAAER